MLRRLLIAVFVIGLIAAVNGTAFADENPQLDRKEMIRGQAQVPAKAKMPTYRTQPADFQRSADDAQGPIYQALNGSPAASPTSPDTTTACPYEQDYTDYAGSAFYYNWTRPGGDDRELAMRFDIQQSHVAELYGSYYYLFEAEAGAEVQAIVYGDAGGIPNDADTIFVATSGPLAEDLVGGYYYMDFAAQNGGSPVVVEGYTNYHIGYKSVAAGGEYVLFASDDGGDPTNGGTATGTLRSSYRAGGDWYNAKAYFGDGTDPNFIFTSVSCEYYSDCYVNTPWCCSGYLWGVPDNVYSDGSTQDGFAQRFVAEGPETLTAVTFYHYDFSGSDGAYAWYPQTGTNGVEVAVWNDDGTGNIDESAGPIAVEVIPGGIASLFPATGGDGSANGFNPVTIEISSKPVLLGPYHVTAKMTSPDPADGILWQFISDNSANPASGGSVHYTSPVGAWERTGESANWLAEGFGEEVGYFIRLSLCRDEFANCQNQVLWGVDAQWLWSMYDGANNDQMAQKVLGNPVNRVDKVRFQIADETVLGGNPGDNGSPQVQMNIYADGGSEPGAIIYSQVITNPVYYPGWNEVVIPGGFQVLGTFWVGYQGIFPDPALDYFYAFTDSDAQPPINGGAYIYRLDYGPAWISLNADFGYLDNLMMEVEFCSVPVEEWPCAPGSDWATIQGGMQRDGHSGNALGDAYCDLTNTWSYEHPTNVANYAGPIVKDGKVVQAFDNEYMVFQLSDGTVLDVLGPFGNGLSCTPSIYSVDIAGTPTDVLFVSGGSDGTIYAYDWSAIGTSPAPIWSYDPAGSGTTRWGNFMVLNDGTIDVLYFTQDNAKLWAVEAATGVKYTGWTANPISIPGFGPTTNRNGTSNGSDRIYYGVQDPGFLGDIYSIDAFTGAIDWQLSTAGGLQAATLFSLANSDEGFDGGIAYEAPFGSAPARLYVNSSVTGNNPVDGVFYILNADDGSVLAATAANRMRYGTPIVDAQRVYVPSFTRWVTPPAGGDLYAINKDNGFIVWAFSHNQSSGLSRYYNEGLMTCEVNAPDLIFAMSESGFLSCVNSETGDEIFHRRIDYGSTYGQNIGGPGALVPDTLVFSHYYGGISTLAKTGVERPRLELLKGRERAAIPFGTNVDTTIIFPAVYTNTGCAELTTTLTASDVSNGSTPVLTGAGASGSASIKAERLAEMMSFSDFIPSKYTQVNANEITADQPLNRDDVRERTVSAATAVPPYLVVGTYNDVLSPGDTADIAVRVNQSSLTRGQFPFYVQIASNDPDYFLNPSAVDPEVSLLLISGCILDTTTMHFGAGGLNEQLVTNTGRLGTGDWGDGPAGYNGFLIDGAGVEYYQGGYVYGVSQKRIAMNTQDWTSGTTPLDGEAASYVSLQPDPNYFNGDCKPAIEENIQVGSYSTDGVTYDPLYGSVVYKSFLDSVQIWTDESGTWDWSLVTSGTSGEFDNDSTMGLYCNSRTVGVLDAPSVENLQFLNQMTIEVFDFEERNGDSVLDWGMAHFVDYDIGNDTVTINRNISTSWTFDQDANEDAWGTVKIPFGPGYTPTKNNIGIVGEQNVQGFWEYGTYWDSVYFYINDYPTGAIISTVGGTMQEGDGEAHQSLVSGVNFGGHDTYSFAVAQWALHGVPGINSPGSPEVAAMAHIANKFVGFGRGDMNNDNAVDISDLIRLAQHLFDGGPNAVPFAYLSDVNADGTTDVSDLNYMVNYYFYGGPAPVGDYEI